MPPLPAAAAPPPTRAHSSARALELRAISRRCDFPISPDLAGSPLSHPCAEKDFSFSKDFFYFLQMKDTTVLSVDG
jgi:hypothetical protein